jgi:hypothetical protein
MNDQHLYDTYQPLEKIERAIKNEKLTTLGTQDTIFVLIYISVNKCMLSYTTRSFVDDMNSLFAFQTKYAKQNVVLKIIDAKRYALISNNP